MRNIWKLFVSDLKRMGGNTITALVMLGLVLMPSLFSWYNMLACWDVFDHSGNLTVAVANSDEGYESDLFPMELNIGETLVSELRANDQLNWVFTNEEDAVDGARSGRYYAAVVIPADFSSTMMSFYETNGESASITYYSNEKKSAIAPKVTDQGADQVSAQVNRTFSETMTEVALALAQSLSDYADKADASGSVGRLAAHLQEVSAQVDRTASAIGAYADVLGTAEALVDESGELLAKTKSSANEVASIAKSAKSDTKKAVSALDESAKLLDSAIGKSVDAFAGMPESFEATFASADSLAADSAATLRDEAAAIDKVGARYHALADDLAQVAKLLPQELEAAKGMNALVARVEGVAATHDGMRDSLLKAADEIEANATVSQETREEVSANAAKAKASLADARAEFDDTLKPAIDELESLTGKALSALTDSGNDLKSIGDKTADTAKTLKDGIADGRSELDAAAKELSATAKRIGGIGDDIAEALTAEDPSALEAALGSDPAALAQALSAPVQLEREAIYPVNNFGSAMAPLYTSLALWIGVLLMMVTLRVLPSERTVRELDNPTLAQLFCGRFGIVAVLSFLQSTVLAVGNLLFLRVQANDPLLYLVCFWVTGLVFAFIVYTLVATFGNLGKALSVVLLILQVSGGGGSFPMSLLPDAIQQMSPYLPTTHVVNAMRAAMFGVYNGDFWVELGILALFTVPFIFIGLVFRKPILATVQRFVEKVEKSKIM